MGRHVSDERLDRAIVDFLADRRAQIEATAMSSDQASSRVRDGESARALGRATVRRRLDVPNHPTRSQMMNSMLKVAGVAVLALAVGVTVLPRGPDIGAAPAPSASPAAEPAPLRAGSLTAGTYSVAPFVPPDEWTLCMAPPQPGCVETASDDAITFTFTVPEGWEGAPFKTIWLAGELNADPGGAGLGFSRGGSLYSDPCLSTSSPPTPDIAVGPSVDEFADALADHPLLDVTTPVDVTLDGYAGRYLELRTPADISGCDPYLPWEPGLFSQPSRVWHLWILDVEGVRVVVMTTDYPGTAPEARAELEGIVDSIRIHVAPTPAASSSPLEASSTVRGWPENRSNPAGLYSWTPRSPTRMSDGLAGIRMDDIDDIDPDSRVCAVYRLCRFAEYVRSKDGIDGPHSDVPTMVSDEQGPEWRRQLWYVDGGEMRLFVLLQSYPDIEPEDLAEAEAVVESIRAEPLGTDDGYRFVFELPDGWGTG